MIHNIYIVKSGKVDFFKDEEVYDVPDLECFTDLNGAFHIYWTLITSASNLDRKIWMEVRDNNGYFLDISKGTQNIIYLDHKTGTRCTYRKDINYIENMIKANGFKQA